MILSSLRSLSILLVVLVTSLAPARAQQTADDIVWVQIEAHPSLRVAEARAAFYAANLPDVNAFSLGGNWYGVALGPYRRADANRVLQVYRGEGQIPRDSYIAESRSFGAQIFPQGADVLNRGAATPPAATQQQQAQAQTQAPAVTEAVPSPPPPDETPNQARRSERQLTGQERKALQIALQAAGFYKACLLYTSPSPRD